jgi:hypothetical protein
MLDLRQLRPMRTAVLVEKAWSGLARLGLWMAPEGGAGRFSHGLKWLTASRRKPLMSCSSGVDVRNSGLGRADPGTSRLLNGIALTTMTRH